MGCLRTKEVWNGFVMVDGGNRIARPGAWSSAGSLGVALRDDGRGLGNFDDDGLHGSFLGDHHWGDRFARALYFSSDWCESFG